MILGARLLLLIVIMDCFLYFGMAAVGAPGGYGDYAGQFVEMNASVDSGVNDYVNYSSGGTMVQASSLGWTSIGIDSIINFVGAIYGIMTAPLNFATTLGMPVFVQVLVGSVYIVLVLASVAQLLTGRFA